MQVTPAWGRCCWTRSCHWLKGWTPQQTLGPFLQQSPAQRLQWFPSGSPVLVAFSKCKSDYVTALPKVRRSRVNPDWLWPVTAASLFHLPLARVVVDGHPVTHLRSLGLGPCFRRASGKGILALWTRPRVRCRRPRGSLSRLQRLLGAGHRRVGASGPRAPAGRPATRAPPRGGFRTFPRRQV